MKRRVEEAAKQEGSSSSSGGVVSGRTSSQPGGPAIVYNTASVRQHHNRGITPPGCNIVQPSTFLSTSSVNKTVPSDRVGSTGNTSGEVAMPAFSLASSYAMPGATATAIKGTGAGLQGGAPSGPGLQTSLHTLQAQPQVLTQQQHGILQAQAHQQIRHKVHAGSTTPPTAPVAPSQQQSQQSQQQFQKLKVEDALSYLDQVKFKFGNQPQVYNDFLDIMKEFKSQSIDTPGVIARVSDLFKGHPELIVGFNTFLPPGYKIEVQQNDQGYAFQVSVSIPSPTASTTTVVHTPGGPIPTNTHATTTLITPIGPPSTTPNASNIAVVAPMVQQTVPASTPAVPQAQATVPATTPPIQAGQPTTVAVSMGKPLTIISNTGSLVSHHTTPLVGSNSLPTPTISAGSTTVPVLLSNASTAPTHTASPSVSTLLHPPVPQHNPYTQSSISAPTTTATIAGGGVSTPHGVNSVSSTSGAQATGPSHHNSHHLNSGTSLHHAGMAQAVSQAHQAVSQGLSHPENIAHSTQSQPVEFNHAINYVNKIKNRFQGQPDKYKRFLEILHTYQKEQRNLKEGVGMGTGGAGGKHLTEAEVYSQVAKLFENQDDLLAEFGQFLPDATSHQASIGSKALSNDHHAVKKPPNPKLTYNSNSCSAGRERENATPGTGLVMMGSHTERTHGNVSSASKFSSSGGVKRSPSFSSSTSNSSHHAHHSHVHSSSHGTHTTTHSSHGPPPPKKHKASIRDVTLADAGKYGSLTDYAFFDNVRKALRSPEVYTNFLRCLQLFNEEVVSKTELVQLVTPFLGKFPELFRRFKDFVGACEGNVNAPGVHGLVSSLGSLGHSGSVLGGVENIPNNVARQDRPMGDHALEIDYSTCKRLGASYCALPKSYMQPKCTGRTPLCREVLNDTWVSFPTWSEDSTFVTSRKTQYEEYIYRCEDERFELDVVIETNAATIRVLEGVHKKMQRLTPEEVAKYRLDDCLGGASPTIHQRALRRIYGDKAADIIDGLKKNPSVAVPVVLRRLKSKEEEWREAQKGFNKIWREQNEKYYLKSLDHQGINFKQNDVKQLRSKSLFNEIETLFDERHEQAEEGNTDGGIGPHLVLPYKDKSVLNDAADLLIHHVKRQTSIHKEDKQRVKQLLRHYLPDLFFHPRQELSDDEREDVDGDEDNDTSTAKTAQLSDRREPVGASTFKKEEGDSDVKPPPHAVSQHPDECYSLFFGNNNWYLFLRLHHILCERLTRMYDRAVALANEEAKYRIDRKESTAVALRLKPKNEIDVEDYYPAFLEMVRNVLDGNMDSNAYEDTLREMFGIHAYIAFTLDKVVTYAVRQLQHLVTDEPCQECQALFLGEQRRGGMATGGPCSTAHQRTAAEAAYQRQAEQTLADENCFKILVYKRDCKVTIELLDTESEEQEPASEVSKWSNYVERERRLSNADESSNAQGGNRAKEEREVDAALLRQRKAVFLARNVRRKKHGQPEFSGEVKGLSPAAESVSVPEERDETPPEVDKAASDRKRTKDKSSSEGDEDMEVDDDAEASGRRRQSKQGKPKPLRVNHILNMGGDSLDATDELQCHFNQSSYRMVYIINRDTYLYREQALPKARQSHPTVSTRLNNKFRAWHTRWAREHVSDAQQKSSNDWLMGRGEGVVPNRTRALTNNDTSKPPYRTYNRYRVDRLVSDGATSVVAES